MEINNEDVLVLVLSDNSVDRIERSIESIFRQSFDSRHIKIVAVDNWSTDGTYEKLLKYTKEIGISVYRLEKRYLDTRLLYRALVLLQFTEYRYITILSAGDILYPNYIEKCAGIMDAHANTDRKILLCETDLINQHGNISHQIPVFSKNCVLLRGEHLICFFINGMGHKVQCFYCYGAIPTTLSELPFYVDYTDWFKKALFSFRTECIYIKNALACTRLPEYDDKLYDLILRLSLVTKFKIYRNAYPGERNSYLDAITSDGRIYENLSLLALQYAAEALEEGNRTIAGQMLIFAEIVNEHIGNNALYSMLKTSTGRGGLADSVGKYKVIEDTASPPDGAIII